MTSDLAKGNEIDVRAWVAIVWRQRKFVFAIVGLFVLLGITYLHIARYRYSVSIEIAPAAPSSAKPSSGMLSALSSITGMGGGSGDNFQMAVDGMKSEGAAQLLAQNASLMHRIFANEWDEKDRSWHQPPSHTRWLTSAIKNVMGLPVTPWRAPSAARLYDYIFDHVNVIQDPKSAVVTLQMNDADPQLAADVLTALNKSVDTMLRDRTIRRSDGYIHYILDTIDHTTVGVYRQSLLDNLNEQTRQRMMAAATNVAFTSDQFSGPVISASPVSPAAVFVLLFSVLFGVIAGSGVALAANRFGWRFPEWRRTATRQAREVS